MVADGGPVSRGRGRGPMLSLTYRSRIGAYIADGGGGH